MAYFELTFSGYVLPRLAQWDADHAAGELTALAGYDRPLWLHFDPFYNAGQQAALGELLDMAASRRIGIVPVIGAFVRDDQCAPLAVQMADGTPGPAICYHQPDTLALAVERATAIIAGFGGLPCLHIFTGQPVLHFAPELAPSADFPCYCAHCTASFAAHLEAHGFDPVTAPPLDDGAGYLWWQWLDFQADAIHRFALRLMQETRSTVPFWIAR